MSAVVKFDLAEIKDKASLMAALSSMGMKELQESDANALSVTGYYGNEWGKATVNVPRSANGLCADIGFNREGDGFQMLIDHIDESRLDRTNGGTSGSFRESLNMWYNAHYSAQTLELQGYTTSVQKQQNGELRLTATVYA